VRYLAAVLALTIVIAAFVRFGDTPTEESYRQAVGLFRSGDFETAARKANHGWQRRSPSDLYWRFRLLEVDALMEGSKTAQALALLDTTSPQTSIEFEIRRRVLKARGAARVGDFQRASALLREAAELAVVHSRLDLESEADSRMAELLGSQGQFGPAESASKRARSSAQAAGDNFRVAFAINNLGMLRMLGSRCDAAIPLFDEAREIWRSDKAQYWASKAAVNLVLCYGRLGDSDKALAYQDDLRSMRPGVLLSRALGETGSAFFYQQKPLKAIPYYRQARDMASQYGSPPDAARWAGNLTSALAAIGDWDDAEQALQEALRLGPEPRSRAYLDLDAGDIAQGRKRFDDARTIYEKILASNSADAAVRWQAYAGIANTWTAEGYSSRANRNFEAAIGVIEGNQSDLNGSENKITFLAALIHFYQDYVDALMTQTDPVKALAVADSSRARVLSQRFDEKLPGATPSQGSEFSAIARQSDAIWMSYWLAPRRSFLWITTPKETRVFVLPSSDEIAKLVDEYSGFVETVRDPLVTQNDAGRALYDMLVVPAASMLPIGARVIIVPDGPLHRLSFETLPIYGGDKPRYWMDDATIAVAPSFGVFHGGGKGSGSQKALILGNPLSPGPDFPALPHAPEEIASVRKHLSGAAQSVITGDNARPEAWSKLKPGNFDIIHIAAHAEANQRSPLDSAVILSPGSDGFRLYARNIIDVPLHADLVTLSACRSSGARTYAGEGLVGLTWAFLQAGARNVVAGLWDVSDESTSMLMDNFYAAIGKGMPPADALQIARRELRKTAYAKPYYWGAFQCYLR